MCGRYVSVADDGDLVAEFDVHDVVEPSPGPSWNVAPTDPVRIVVERIPTGADTIARQLRTARWGLVPNWSKDAKGGAKMINARIETVTQKPAFKSAAARRRCLVPALGYYEWQQREGTKVPHFLHDPQGRLLAMAGLYELWRENSHEGSLRPEHVHEGSLRPEHVHEGSLRPEPGPGDAERWLLTCTIITQQATDLLGEIHDRTPVVVSPDLRAAWLDCTADDAAVARELLDAIPAARLEPYVVGPAVGNVRNNGPELIEPTAVLAEQLPLDL